MKGGHNLQLIEGGQYLDEVKAEYNRKMKKTKKKKKKKKWVTKNTQKKKD